MVSQACPCSSATRMPLSIRLDAGWASRAWNSLPIDHVFERGAVQRRVSWATPAICQPAGRLKLPLSMASSPRTSAKKVDLPQRSCHQAHLVGRVYGGLDVVQQRAAAAIKFDLTGNYHGWIRFAQQGEKLARFHVK